MKIRLALLSIAALLLFSFTTDANKGKKGNKKMTTKVIPISDYSTLRIKGNPNVTYEQSSVLTPYLKIEIDENLVNDLEISQEGDILKIEEKEDLKPSKFTIYTHSSSLRKVAISGNASVNIGGEIQSDEFSADLAGDGIIKAESVKCHYAIARLAGNGEIILKGESVQASYDLAGNGKINGENLNSLKSIAAMVGNGIINVNSKESLDIKVAGNGTINYKGEPTIKKDVMGDVTINSID